MTCRDKNCPDCHPEEWIDLPEEGQQEEEEGQAWAWPYAVILLGLLILLAFLYAGGSPP